MGMKRISFETVPQHAEWSNLRDFWRTADDIDVYDAGWTFDHFVPIFGKMQGPVLEGWTTLAALAAEVRRLRMGVLVSGVTHRHPSVLAAMAATIDVISQGRLEIGLGAAWNEPEHEAFGIDFPPVRERMDRLEEALAVVDALLTQDEASFDGEHYRLRNARLDLKPVQSPRPPFMIGGGGERRTLRIVARWADVWHLGAGEVEVFRHKLEVLHGHCADVGRDPAEIEASTSVSGRSDPKHAAEKAAALVEAGAQHIIVAFNAPFDPARLEPFADALGGLLDRGAPGTDLR